MKRVLSIFLIGIFVILGILIPSCSRKVEQKGIIEHKEHAGKQIYHCPMHPTYTSDKPGECPICGMNLVPVEQEEKKIPKKKIMYRSTMNPNEVSDKPGKDSMGMDMEPFEVEVTEDTSTVPGRAVVRVTPEKQQIIGVRFAEVKTRELKKIIRAVGRVDYVEPALAFVNTKFDGWIEKLYVDYTGKFVKKGQPLADIYSPELVSTQEEYLIAFKSEKDIKNKDITNSLSSNFSVLESARQRLKFWDITEDQIKRLEETGDIKKTLTIYSPVNGYVIEKNVIDGQRIMSGENLYKIADISKVWIYGDIYEYEIPLVKVGDSVNITLSYLPGETFTGTVSYIYPYLEEETRTNKIRVEADNKDFKLKPGMYANLEIVVDLGKRLVVPSSAILDSGEQKYLFVDIGDGYFEPRAVKTGIATDDYYEILEGVKEGEKVVTSAAFLIDSESSLKAALEGMGAPSGGGHAGHGQ